jgi:hypothetical protein
MSINKLILISLLINIYLADDQNDESEIPPDFISDLTCGKSIDGTPKKEKDCTDYGTGSGMLCCFVADSKDGDGSCYLLPASLGSNIKDAGGKKLFMKPKSGQKAYWSCGNKSYFLNIDIIMIFLILFLL